MIGHVLGVQFNFAQTGANLQLFLGGVTITATPTPEPSTAILLVIGLIGLLAYAWRRRR